MDFNGLNRCFFLPQISTNFHKLFFVGNGKILAQRTAMGKQKQWQRRASEMPDDAKHHASVLVRKDAQLGDSNVYTI